MALKYKFQKYMIWYFFEQIESYFYHNDIKFRNKLISCVDLHNKLYNDLSYVNKNMLEKIFDCLMEINREAVMYTILRSARFYYMQDMCNCNMNDSHKIMEFENSINNKRLRHVLKRFVRIDNNFIKVLYGNQIEEYAILKNKVRDLKKYFIRGTFEQTRAFIKGIEKIYYQN